VTSAYSVLSFCLTGGPAADLDALMESFKRFLTYGDKKEPVVEIIASIPSQTRSCVLKSNVNVTQLD